MSLPLGLIAEPNKKTTSKNYEVVIVMEKDNYHSQAFTDIADGLVNTINSYGYLAIKSEILQSNGFIPIVFGSHMIKNICQLPKNSIIFNLEQLGSGSPHISPIYYEILRSHQIWDYSKNNIKFLNQIGVFNATYIDIACIKQATFEASTTCDIDVLFYGAINARRKDVIDALAATGITVVAISGIYGRERDFLMSRAKIILNLHYYDTKIFEIVRVSYALQNGKFVLSEIGYDNCEREYSGVVSFCAYENIVDRCLEFLSKPNQINLLSASAKKFMYEKQNSNILLDILNDY